MESRSLQALTLVAVVIGAAVLGGQLHVIGTTAAIEGDLALLLALFAFDTAAPRSGIQSLALGTAAACCLLIPLQISLSAIGLIAAPSNGQTFADRPALITIVIWLAVALLLFAIDRFRMTARESPSPFSGGLMSAPPVAAAIPLAPPVASRPEPIRVFTPEPVHPSLRDELPLSSYAEPVPPVPAEPQPEPAPMPPADVTAIPPGREAVIYLNLVGEGLNVLRTVRAESLGRDYFRIADIMPEGEQWEFVPGQVVRCRKKSLSNGKHMVAYEEAPRA